MTSSVFVRFLDQMSSCFKRNPKPFEGRVNDLAAACLQCPDSRSLSGAISFMGAIAEVKPKVGVIWKRYKKSDDALV